MYRIIGADGREYGPVTTEQLRQWIVEGRVNAVTQARAEDGQWQTLAQLPEFAVLFAGAPPPLPQPRQAAPASFNPAGAPERTSGLAIASLVCGILGFFSCGLGALAGLILGIIGLVIVKKSNGRLSGSGLAIAGIAISGCVLLLMPALLLPALARAKQKAQTLLCINNAHQLGLAVQMYAAAHNNQLPPAVTWSDAISGQVLSTNVFHCPSQLGQRCSYAYNQALDGKRVGQVNRLTVLIFQSDLGWNGAGRSADMAQHRHFAIGREPAYVVVHVDGSSELVPQSRLSTLRWQP